MAAGSAGVGNGLGTAALHPAAPARLRGGRTGHGRERYTCIQARLQQRVCITGAREVCDGRPGVQGRESCTPRVPPARDNLRRAALVLPKGDEGTMKRCCCFVKGIRDEESRANRKAARTNLLTGDRGAENGQLKRYANGGHRSGKTTHRRRAHEAGEAATACIPQAVSGQRRAVRLKELRSGRPHGGVFGGAAEGCS